MFGIIIPPPTSCHTPFPAHGYPYYSTFFRDCQVPAHESMHCERESTHCAHESTHCRRESIHCERESMHYAHESMHCERESTHCGRESTHCAHESTHYDHESMHCERESTHCGATGNPAADANRVAEVSGNGKTQLCQPIGSWIRSAGGAVSGEPRTRQNRAGTARQLGGATADAQHQSGRVVRPRTRNGGGISAAHAPSPQPAGGATRQQA